MRAATAALFHPTSTSHPWPRWTGRLTRLPAAPHLAIESGEGERLGVADQHRRRLAQRGGGGGGGVGALLRHRGPVVQLGALVKLGEESTEPRVGELSEVSDAVHQRAMPRIQGCLLLLLLLRLLSPAARCGGHCGVGSVLGSRALFAGLLQQFPRNLVAAEGGQHFPLRRQVQVAVLRDGLPHALRVGGKSICGHAAVGGGREQVVWVVGLFEAGAQRGHRLVELLRAKHQMRHAHELKVEKVGR